MTQTNRNYLRGRTARELRALAVGMPHRSEATKAELETWLRKYRPEALLAATPEPAAPDVVIGTPHQVPGMARLMELTPELYDHYAD